MSTSTLTPVRPSRGRDGSRASARVPKSSTETSAAAAPPPARPAARPLPRSAGVLLHLTSLPGPFGTGDLGPAAYAWVDQLNAAKQTWWQTLPLTPVGEGNSPYSSRSAFAGNPLLVSPELLVRDGLLRKADLPPDDFVAGRVEFDRVLSVRGRLLAVAHDRFAAGGGGTELKAAFDAFRRAEAGWLDDYALYSALKGKFGVATSHTAWPKPLLRRDQAALRDAARELARELDRLAFEQFLFYRQLAALRAYAAGKGVKLFGDVPIYVSGESADVWSHPDLFQLDARLKPKRVAGVPPDLFCVTGQRWGNPLYDWDAMRADGFRWWADRMRQGLRQADLIRIDHFRGLAGYWSIPATAPTAERGRWVSAPGQDLMAALGKALGGLPIVAEDLGVITPDVEALRDDFRLPGMQILQFAFGEDDSPSLPHRHGRNAIVYTGTHDNQTTTGWAKSLDAAGRKRLHRYAPETERDPVWGLIRLAWASVADVAIVPMQDLLTLGDKARMNSPGSGDGNWGWRLTATPAATRAALARLGELTATYGRTPRETK
ncbi:MAG: malQ [Phycisphaerales bacterium]|nr:malQ [Phycisphaerales bacterium]